jgi:hypothetical protein
MIQHIWTVICSEAIFDKETNLVSLINVIEELTIQAKPKPKGKIGIALDIVSFWMRSNEDEPSFGKYRISLVSPEGKVLNTVEGELDLTIYQRLRTRTKFIGFPANQPGRYIFRVDQEEEESKEFLPVANIPIRVIFQTPVSEPQEEKSPTT